MIPEKLTVPEKLLLAALKARETTPTFTAEDLVVQAWTLYPDTFGLAGYSKLYPDSNRILTNIMGGKGMRAKGWLRKVGEKLYRLTSQGINDGEALLTRVATQADDHAAPKDALRAELDRQTARALERLLTTQAAQKALRDRMEQITFHEASGFWDITARSNANTLLSRLNDTELLLSRAADALTGAGTADDIRLSQATVSLADIQKLLEAHAWMQGQFKAELDILRRRTDERLERRLRA
jgi:hypothetical protein